MAQVFTSSSSYREAVSAWVSVVTWAVVRLTLVLYQRQRVSTKRAWVRCRCRPVPFGSPSVRMTSARYTLGSGCSLNMILAISSPVVWSVPDSSAYSRHMLGKQPPWGLEKLFWRTPVYGAQPLALVERVPAL